MRVRSQSGVFYGCRHYPVLFQSRCVTSLSSLSRQAKEIFVTDLKSLSHKKCVKSVKRYISLARRDVVDGNGHYQGTRPKELVSAGEGAHLSCGPPSEDGDRVQRRDRHRSRASTRLRLREAVRPMDETQTPRRALVDDRRTCRRTASERDRATLTIDK